MQVELKDGSTADVYEHGMTLEIVALRGSIPQQWVLEFRCATCPADVQVSGV
jgi:hypothetical protein